MQLRLGPFGGRRGIFRGAFGPVAAGFRVPLGATAIASSPTENRPRRPVMSPETHIRRAPRTGDRTRSRCPDAGARVEEATAPHRRSGGSRRDGPRGAGSPRLPGEPRTERGDASARAEGARVFRRVVCGARHHEARAGDALGARTSPQVAVALSAAEERAAAGAVVPKGPNVLRAALLPVAREAESHPHQPRLGG